MSATYYMKQKSFYSSTPVWDTQAEWLLRQLVRHQSHNQPLSQSGLVTFQGTQTHSGICGFVCMRRWYGVNPLTSHSLLIIVFLLAFQYSCPPDYFFLQPIPSIPFPPKTCIYSKIQILIIIFSAYLLIFTNCVTRKYRHSIY